MDKTAAAKRLRQEISDLKKQKPSGFTVDVDENNIFKWHISIFGPPDTLYAGGFFKGLMEFPQDYPFSPPKFKFITKMWHPNIYYDSGDVCISILHSPVPDQQSGERAEERWRPTQEARTIILSVISLFTCPNTFSPANVDASIQYRNWVEKGDDYYRRIIIKQVEKTRVDANVANVQVPLTVDEYLQEERAAKVKEEETDFDFDGGSDVDYYDDSASGYSGGGYSDQSDDMPDQRDSGNEDEDLACTPTTKTFPSQFAAAAASGNSNASLPSTSRGFGGPSTYL